ncbi:MAG: (5-formylfuran-3-yl)methyl phosphate synthase [Candidatus Methylopumilus sp.]
MIKLLASVTSSQEALWALEAGVDIIDLKNPAEGALGALPLAVITEVVQNIRGRAPVSATIGDLPMNPELIADAIVNTAKAGVDIVKVGFFPSADSVACIEAIKPLISKGIKVVAVLFADGEIELRLLPVLSAAGFFGVMLDTAHKNGLSLLDNQPFETIYAFIAHAKTLGLETGLAGSLRLEHIAQLRLAKPGYMGFRGALCINFERNATLVKSKIFELSVVLQKNNKNVASSACI